MPPEGARVVCIGECMVEFAPNGQGGYNLGFAGDTFNMAWYLRHSLPRDWAVEYMTALGDDAMSLKMRAFMAAAGIGTSHVPARPGMAPGLYVITLDGAERSFSYWRGQSAARTLADDGAALTAALAGARAAVFSGITLAILPPQGRSNLFAALKQARAAGTWIVFDPNLRPRLWHDAATMRKTVTAAAAHADVILPSFEDDSLAFGDEHPAATVQRYAASGAGLVVVKDGPRPIIWAEGANTGEYQPPPVPALVDTTAAGDSFNAAFLAARLSGAAIPDCAAAGAALAARVIGARGALVAL